MRAVRSTMFMSAIPVDNHRGTQSYRYAVCCRTGDPRQPGRRRLAVRKARSVPLMQSLYDWIQLQMATLSRHSDTAKAFSYLLKQWDALNEYCRNGWVEIDNNLCENALRVVALGHRNYMFFGSDGGGDSAAVMYSLIGSCKLNGIEPESWLRHVISVISTWSANRVKELLPWNVTLSVN
jgi:transposase